MCSVLHVLSFPIKILLVLYTKLARIPIALDDFISVEMFWQLETIEVWHFEIRKYSSLITFKISPELFIFKYPTSCKLMLVQRWYLLVWHHLGRIHGFSTRLTTTVYQWWDGMFWEKVFPAFTVSLYFQPSSPNWYCNFFFP